VRQALRVVLACVVLGAGAASAQTARPIPAKPIPAKPSAAPAAPRVWLAREIAQIPEQQVWLFGQDGSSVGVARTEQLRSLLAVFGKLEQISGISSELFISEGTDPDTWLAQGKGDQIVVRINLGLITMLGADWDAWAFVLGHQLAHIELFSRSRQELQRREVGEPPPPPALTPDEEEKVADGLGLEYAIRAGYKPDGANLFLNRLAVRDPGSSFLRRHPFYSGRMDYVRDLGATLAAARRGSPRAQTQTRSPVDEAEESEAR
jgi:hypothetical protein